MDGHALPVQYPLLQKNLEHLRHAARAVKIDRDEPSRGLEVAQHRYLAPHGASKSSIVHFTPAAAAIAR